MKCIHCGKETEIGTRVGYDLIIPLHRLNRSNAGLHKNWDRETDTLRAPTRESWLDMRILGNKKLYGYGKEIITVEIGEYRFNLTTPVLRQLLQEAEKEE